MKSSALTIFGLLLMGVVFVSPANAEMKEGKWDMTMVTKMDNMPPEMAEAMKQMQNLPPQALAAMKKAGVNGMQMNGDGQGMTVSVTQCITKKNPIPKNMPKEDNCQETHDFSGDTVNFHTTCSAKDLQVEATGSMKYSGDSMQGQIKSHESRGGRSLNTTIDITGKYAGSCS